MTGIAPEPDPRRNMGRELDRLEALEEVEQALAEVPLAEDAHVVVLEVEPLALGQGQLRSMSSRYQPS